MKPLSLLACLPDTKEIDVLGNAITASEAVLWLPSLTEAMIDNDCSVARGKQITPTSFMQRPSA